MKVRRDVVRPTLDLNSPTRSDLERSAIKGDSPVGVGENGSVRPRVPLIGNWAGIREALTSNPKHSWSPIANSTVRER